MPAECTHVLPAGQKCKAPAHDGGSFCRHHTPRNRTNRSLPPESAPFVLPAFEDPSGLLRAVTEVLHAMSDRRIKRSQGGTFLFGLQFAFRLMTHIKDENAPFPSPSPGNPNRLEPAAQKRTSSDPVPYRPQADRQKNSEPTLREAEEFLAAMQSRTVEQALDEWESKQIARAKGLHRYPAEKLVLSSSL